MDALIRNGADDEGLPAVIDPVWQQEPLNRRETYEGPRCLIEEITMLGHLGVQRAVPGALRRHSHVNEFELHLLHDGRFSLWIDSPQQVYNLHGGMASLTTPGAVHGARDEMMLPVRWTWMRFRVPADPGSAMPGLSLRETRQLRAGLDQVGSPIFRYSSGLERCLKRLIEEHRSPTPESALVCRAILHELMVWIIRDGRGGESTVDAARAAYSPAIGNALAWLDAHLEENLSVGDMAEVAGLSESYFRRRFHSELGCSPADYVAHTRINRGKQLLTSTRLSITQIAMRLGFNSSAYFTAVFHKQTGITPSEYRASQRPHDKGDRESE